MKSIYDEGSVFLIPLRDGGFARGVVARIAPKRKVLLGYFFGPRLEKEALACRSELWPCTGHHSLWGSPIDQRAVESDWEGTELASSRMANAELCEARSNIGEGLVDPIFW